MTKKKIENAGEACLSINCFAAQDRECRTLKNKLLRYFKEQQNEDMRESQEQLAESKKYW